MDDTSANLVYKDRNIARKAMLSLIVDSENVNSEEIQQNPFVIRTAKKLVNNEGCMLTLRVAMEGDRKRKNARDASRYYLMHPEADPTERTRRAPARGENGDYKRRRFDDREHRRRRHHDDEVDPTNDFAASMYDDAPSEKKEPENRGRDLFSRITKPRQRSASPTANGDAIPVSDSEEDYQPRRRRNAYRDRDSPPPRRRNNQGRELFGDAPITRDNGMRSDDPTLLRKQQQPSSKSPTRPSYEANQGVARQLRADLKAAQNNSSPARSHRRTRAIDSRVEEDLSERFGRKSISLDSTKSVMQTTANSGKELFDRDVNMNNNGDGGFSIKGSASQGFSIKGRAGDVKELFPDRFATGGGSGSSGRGGNAGKELFDQPVRARGPRQKAGDLFD